MQQRERLSDKFPIVLERFLVHSLVFRSVRFATSDITLAERYLSLYNIDTYLWADKIEDFLVENGLFKFPTRLYEKRSFTILQNIVEISN